MPYNSHIYNYTLFTVVEEIMSTANRRNFCHIYTIRNLQLEDNMISPPNTVCVTTLPCKNLDLDFIVFTCIKQLIFYMDSFCPNFVKVTLKELYQTNVTFHK